MMPNNRTTQRLTPKQERFAQAYMNASSAADAYRDAYNTENMRPSCVWVEAHNVLNNPKVSKRIAELRAKQERNVEINRDKLTEMLFEAHEMAREQGNSQAMIAAADKLGRLWGEMVERSEVKDVTDGHTDAIRQYIKDRKEKRGLGVIEGDNRKASGEVG